MIIVFQIHGPRGFGVFGVLGFWGEVRLGCVRLWEGDTFFEFLDVPSVVCDRAILWVMGGTNSAC